MPRQPNGAGRYYVTLDAADADALEAAARQNDRPPTTEAGLRIVQTLHAEIDGEASALTRAELATAQRELESLRVANAALRRQLREAVDPEEAGPPRWEWPIEHLLGDQDWWRAWLPRLHQLLGRPEAFVYTGRAQVAVDRHGYVDLMGMLFPPARETTGREVVWSSADYALAIERASEPAGPLLAAVWEPVVRHVAVALSALEATAVAGTRPSVRIRTEEEISGPWLETLRRLTGADVADLSALKAGFR